MTDERYAYRLKICLEDIYSHLDPDLNHRPGFDDALARFVALQLCYTQGKRRRPWAALVSVLMLLCFLLLIVYEILKVLYIEGTTC